MRYVWFTWGLQVVNWRRLANRKIDLSREPFPAFEISVTKVAQRDTSRVFMMPSPGAMSFIATVGDGLIYLSSPYSSGGMVGDQMALDRVEQTRAMLFVLMNMGATVISTIVSGSGMSPYGSQESHDWWMHRDLKLLRKCDCVAVLTLDGWEDSPGVQEEVELAIILQKPVYLIKEGT
jgi:hypothetical protein